MMKLPSVLLTNARKTSLALLAFANLALAPMALADDEIDPIDEIFEPALPARPENFGKVAVVQWAPPTAELVETRDEAEAIKDRNRRKLEKQIRIASKNGAKIIITSEIATVGYPDIPELPDADDNFRTREEIGPYAETIPGPTTNYFSRLAKELGVYLQIGLVEVDANDLYYNASIALSPEGALLAKHRKVSLFKQEEDYFTPGKGGTVYETPYGKIGMMICADVYDWNVLREYTNNVDVIALSTSWAQMNTGWSYFTRAATTTRSILVAANQPYFPDSGVINRDGSVQSHIRQTTYGIAYGYLPILKSEKNSDRGIRRR